jgi:uncharacterized protein (TIGR04255 family)
MTKLRNSSNYLTIAEIRFDQVTHIAQHIQTIQAAFRVAHHPDSTMIKSQTINVEQIDHGQVLVPQTHNAYMFSNKNKTSHFILNAQCLTFKTSNFKDIESFLTLFLEGFSIVHQVLKLTSTQRIGLRVLERLVPAKGKQLADYLGPSELNLHQKLGGHSVFSQTEIFHQFKDIQLLNRVKVCIHGGLELPRDIDPADMAFKVNLITYSGPSAYIDSDGYIEKKQKISFANAEKTLAQIHALIMVAYAASVHPKLGIER